MRADTKKKHEMGKRFAILIGVAAAGVMALGAQTAAPALGFVEHDTTVTIYRNQAFTDYWGEFVPEHWYGQVCTETAAFRRRSCTTTKRGRKCMYGREVILFRKRPGPDRKLGATRSTPHIESGHLYWGEWLLRAPERGRVYAKVTRKVGDGFVCRADRSWVILNGGSYYGGSYYYDSKVTITREGSSMPGGVLWHGNVLSDRDRERPEYHPAKAVRKCMVGREVILFKKRPGADLKLGATRSASPHWSRDHWDWGEWWVRAPERGRVYAKVTRKVGDGFVCRADRSGVKLNGGS